ncbi:hypothetical protein HETIRDRAFT_49374 [Heterobasidion irregulare TC 32-1]|uniref:Uncharacterized protein n=1 Tax=Heterobasidion irregulare (strain TC 32-1) TaxID=747525 RepID=W4K303_HETIT|nr:uncharacterized protein HETIRDRAFT_49374 [Heterobasidion irregulare TC 32-1]ETW79730.1 hypothetical protein HETIRDRAFT_49374 [Heterobasidion irregulare TC 32-1]
MSTSTKLAQQLRRISAEWPNDPLRPNMQLKTFLNSLADHPKLSPAAVTAAQVLQENRISKKFPIPEKILKPASMPYHYDRLVEGYEKSLKGIGRPWWKIFFGVW